MGKFNWKVFVVCVVLALSLISAIASPILYFATSNQNDNENVQLATGWNISKGAPNNEEGEIGNYYLDSSTGIVYQKQSSGWVAVYTIGKGDPGTDGATWIYGQGQPTLATEGKIGDFYLDKTLYDVYCRNELGWELIGNIKGTSGNAIKTGKGDPNTLSVSGQVGDLYLDTTTYELYEKDATTWKSLGSIRGKDGSNGSNGSNGTNGEDGKDGTDVYMGYDGYIWNGATRTSWHIPGSTVGDDVFEHTLEVAGVMGKYFVNDFVDLTNNYVALMPYYKKNAEATIFSSMEVKELTVIAKSVGKLEIGTARMSEIVKAREDGVTELSIKNKRTCDVVEGESTIVLKEPIRLEYDETLVLGGNGSASLYYAKDIPMNDEAGNFTLIDGESHQELLANSGMKGYNDTLAVQVKINNAAELPIFENLRNRIEEDIKGGLVSMNGTQASEAYAAYIYNGASLFSGKRITRIGVPVDSLQDSGGRTYLDIYVVKAFNGMSPSEEQTVKPERQKALTPYKDPLEINHDNLETYQQLLEANGGVGWINFTCDIQIGDDETLAFCGDGHGVGWIWLSSEPDEIKGNPYYEPLKFIGQVGKPDYGGYVDSKFIFFDCYYAEDNWLKADQISRLSELEYKYAGAEDRSEELQKVLQGKLISILGDSISTYQDYSNEYETQNSGIRDNNQASPYYEGNKQNYFLDTADMYDGKKDNHGQPVDRRQTLGVPTVNDTWWMSAMNKTGMKLCVNNSSAGDSITSSIVKTRAQQLSDNTYDNEKNHDQHEELFPDIVAIYMGINDFNSSSNVSPEAFYTAYKEVINIIKSTYRVHKNDLTIFVFTLLPSTWGDSDLAKDYTHYAENLEKYNNKIRQIANETDGVEAVDLYNYCGITRDNIATYSEDHLHPNSLGMAKISECFVEALYKKFVA